ncbi:hypothetical protein [Chelativorans salis]|uniref:Uncharacterized protein n=1 Tax=Chelativorans salis TaxID=2978478 RepID=A0ABT2LKQ7_9HYPH|nr:hypothetical protein [Chelativorans sp. EGI FJ00035]MCT7375176.1 hypothetical protein [Chelativorans sp. EGI FJ00035]
MLDRVIMGECGAAAPWRLLPLWRLLWRRRRLRLFLDEVPDGVAYDIGLTDLRPHYKNVKGNPGGGSC